MIHSKHNPRERLLRFLEKLRGFDGVSVLIPTLANFAENGFDSAVNGNLYGWLAALEELPTAPGDVETVLNVPAPAVNLADSNSPPPEFLITLERAMKKLHPWRKGPFDLFGLLIDAEWRSNLKWERLRGKISPLADRLVLDVGCGNGYYGFRMLGEGAAAVVGIDTGLAAALQFQALNRYFGSANLAVFPGSVDSLPESLECFDTVFSMGLLYHRKEPAEHLRRIFSFLKPAGECALESIVIDGGVDDALIPSGRYAMMRNVHCVPTIGLIDKWLRRAGFADIAVLDVSVTTAEEQRSTPWMTYNSLSDFLDPADSSKTVEGYPAPKRAVVTARKP